MKAPLKTLLFTMAILSTCQGWAIGSYAVKDTLYVMTISGLTLRKSPSLNSGARSVLPYGTAIIVKELTNVQDSVADIPNYSINGSWVKVSTPKGDGYVFDGYLTSFQAPKLAEDGQNKETLEAYIQLRYRAESKKMAASKNPLEFNQAFSKGIKFSKRIAKDSSDYGRIMINEISIEEIYLIANVLCRTSIDEKPNYTDDDAIDIKIVGNELSMTPTDGIGLAIKAVRQEVKNGAGGGAIIQYRMLTGSGTVTEEGED